MSIEFKEEKREKRFQQEESDALKLLVPVWKCATRKTRFDAKARSVIPFKWKKTTVGFLHSRDN